jgi:hypothetical protein
MPKSPTQRALEIARGHGYQAAVTEHWNPHARIRQDLFGFCDILAVAPSETLAIQATSANMVSERIKKLLGEEDVALRVWDCLRAGWRVEVWGLRKEADRFGSKLKARTLYLNPLDPEEVLVAECSLAIEGRDSFVA